MRNINENVCPTDTHIPREGEQNSILDAYLDLSTPQISKIYPDSCQDYMLNANLDLSSTPQISKISTQTELHYSEIPEVSSSMFSDRELDDQTQ